jgi:hypothetical protein
MSGSDSFMSASLAEEIGPEGVWLSEGKLKMISLQEPASSS